MTKIDKTDIENIKLIIKETKIGNVSNFKIKKQKNLFKKTRSSRSKNLILLKENMSGLLRQSFHHIVKTRNFFL